MSQFRIYEKLTPIIDFWCTIRKQNGAPENGIIVFVSVFDGDNNSEILLQAMPEVGTTGYYKFRWQPIFSQDKNLFATIFIHGGGSNRTVIDTIQIKINNRYFLENEKIDENDGKAI